MLTVFGSINADLVFPVPSLPTPGETILAAALHLQPGGKGANQAAAAALDSADIALIGAVGTDPLADIALAYLRELKIDLARVVTVPGPTGCASICTDPEGRNQIVVAPGANRIARAASVPPPASCRLISSSPKWRTTRPKPPPSSAARTPTALAPSTTTPPPARSTPESLLPSTS